MMLQFRVLQITITRPA